MPAKRKAAGQKRDQASRRYAQCRDCKRAPRSLHLAGGPLPTGADVSGVADPAGVQVPTECSHQPKHRCLVVVPRTTGVRRHPRRKPSRLRNKIIVLIR